MKKRIYFLFAVAVISHFACEAIHSNFSRADIEIENSRGQMLSTIMDSQ